jgi:AraC family carnitine catabolism transcriptional activator
MPFEMDRWVRREGVPRDMVADWDHGSGEPVGFLLIPRFSMLALFAAIEPLRVANRIAGRELFRWPVFSLDGEPVESSNGMTLVADAPYQTVERLPSLIVCSSFQPERHESKPLLAWLRRLDRQGSTLGGLDTGTRILARAGLLSGYRVTLHWESVPAFRETFPDIEVTGELFEIDRKRLTAAGGTAPLDMMLHLIVQKHGQDLALAVSEMLLHSRIRNPEDHQRMTRGLRLGIWHRKLLKIIETMEQSIEEPFTLTQLAALGGISRRQLERLFKSQLGDSPKGYYLKLRLKQARRLLEESDMTVLQVGLACGFVSASHFSRAYRDHFGTAPREHRRALRDSRMSMGQPGTVR